MQELFKLCMDSSHYYRQYWYWGGEAKLRVNGGKLELTSIPSQEWKTLEKAAAEFWGKIVADGSPRAKKWCRSCATTTPSWKKPVLRTAIKNSQYKVRRRGCANPLPVCKHTNF